MHQTSVSQYSKDSQNPNSHFFMKFLLKLKLVVNPPLYDEDGGEIEMNW